MPGAGKQARTASRIASLGAQVALGHAMSQKPDAQKDLIFKHLESHPQEVETCLLMLEQGYCDPKRARDAMEAANGVSLVPGSCTMLKHLSNKALEQALNRMHPEILTTPILSKVKRNQGKKSLLRLFLNLVQESGSSPIPTHSMEQFQEIYRQQYAALGRRASKLKIVDGEILWHESGSFRLHKEGDGPERFTHIEHASGLKALSTRASDFNACFCHWDLGVAPFLNARSLQYIRSSCRSTTSLWSLRAGSSRTTGR
jgi:hypothetical protein